MSLESKLDVLLAQRKAPRQYIAVCDTCGRVGEPQSVHSLATETAAMHSAETGHAVRATVARAGGKGRHARTAKRGAPTRRDLERVLSMLGDGRTPQHRKAVAGAAMDLVKSGATVTVYSGVKHKGKKKIAAVTMYPKPKVKGKRRKGRR